MLREDAPPPPPSTVLSPQINLYTNTILHRGEIDRSIIEQIEQHHSFSLSLSLSLSFLNSLIIGIQIIRFVYSDYSDYVFWIGF